MNGLDEALIALWEEIKHYPAQSKKDDFDKWNKLNLAGIDSLSGGDINSVEFFHNSQHFKVKERTKDETPELSINLSFFEDDNEVFAIDCLVNSENEGAGYIYQRISTFKKRVTGRRCYLNIMVSSR